MALGHPPRWVKSSPRRWGCLSCQDGDQNLSHLNLHSMNSPRISSRYSPGYYFPWENTRWGFSPPPTGVSTSSLPSPFQYPANGVIFSASQCQGITSVFWKFYSCRNYVRTLWWRLNTGCLLRSVFEMDTCRREGEGGKIKWGRLSCDDKDLGWPLRSSETKMALPSGFVWRQRARPLHSWDLSLDVDISRWRGNLEWRNSFWLRQSPQRTTHGRFGACSTDRSWGSKLSFWKGGICAGPQRAHHMTHPIFSLQSFTSSRQEIIRLSYSALTSVAIKEHGLNQKLLHSRFLLKMNPGQIIISLLMSVCRMLMLFTLIETAVKKRPQSF